MDWGWYTTNYPSTTPTVTDKVSGAGGDLAADNVSGFAKDVPSRKVWSGYRKGDLAVKGLIGTAKGLPYETIAILK